MSRSATRALVLCAAVAAVAGTSLTASASYIRLATGAQVRPTAASATTSSIITNGLIYSNISGGGNANIAITTTVPGAGVNGTVYANNTTWNAAVGATPTAASGFLTDVGTSILVADNTVARIVRINKTGGGVSTYVPYTAGGFTSVLSAGAGVAGQLMVYNTASGSNPRNIWQTNSSGGLDILVSNAQLLASPNASNGLVGVARIGSKIYFGASTGTTRSIFSFDTATSTSAVALAGTSITGVTGVTTGTTQNSFLAPAFFAAPDGKLYFYDNTSNGILSFDPAGGSVASVLTSAQLVAGPALTSTVNGLTWHNGNLAWSVSAGANAGVYAIPEPAALGLLAPVAAVAFRRNRRA